MRTRRSERPRVPFKRNRAGLRGLASAYFRVGREARNADEEKPAEREAKAGPPVRLTARDGFYDTRSRSSGVTVMTRAKPVGKRS